MIAQWQGSPLTAPMQPQRTATFSPSSPTRCCNCLIHFHRPSCVRTACASCTVIWRRFATSRTSQRCSPHATRQANPRVASSAFGPLNGLPPGPSRAPLTMLSPRRSCCVRAMARISPRRLRWTPLTSWSLRIVTMWRRAVLRAASAASALTCCAGPISLQKQMMVVAATVGPTMPENMSSVCCNASCKRACEP